MCQTRFLMRDGYERIGLRPRVPDFILELPSSKSTPSFREGLSFGSQWIGVKLNIRMISAMANSYCSPCSVKGWFMAWPLAGITHPISDGMLLHLRNLHFKLLWINHNNQTRRTAAMPNTIATITWQLQIVSFSRWFAKCKWITTIMSRCKIKNSVCSDTDIMQLLVCFRYWLAKCA